MIANSKISNAPKILHNKYKQGTFLLQTLAGLMLFLFGGSVPVALAKSR
jgi:hypothetical protein